MSKRFVIETRTTEAYVRLLGEVVGYISPRGFQFYTGVPKPEFSDEEWAQIHEAERDLQTLPTS